VKYTEREREILNGWPTVTEEDLVRMNDLFSHYLFFRREGKALHHCVGGYAARHMEGVTTILFLRRTNAPATPYITLEMDGNQLRQIHGYDNERSACPENPGRVSPRTIHKKFLDTWLRWLRAGSKRNEDGAPKVPRRKAAADDEQVKTA